MRTPIIVAAGIAALLVPTAAQAATKQVTVGPPKPLEGVPEYLADTGFYPSRVTIAEGDRLNVTWTTGFGDVIFVPKGQEAPALAVPRPDKPVAGAKDAAGADMWFNGRPNFSPNIPGLSPQGGRVIDGSRIVGSGLALDGPQEPWKVRFAKTGRYTLTSVYHPGKKLRVVVVKRRRDVPSAKQDRKRLKKQIRAATKLAKRLAAFDGPQGDAVRVGNDAGGIAQVAFFPARKTVEVGDTVTFEMSRHSIETHNVHFGPRDYLDGFARSFFGEVFQPFVLYGSDAPGTTASYDGTNHGNGYFNTGALDTDKATPFPAKGRVTFTKPGTYRYYCAMHGNQMTGEIVVR
jgi:plastocyanin